MRVVFTTEVPVAADGVRVVRYAAGAEADIPDQIAMDLIAAKLAKKVKKAVKRGD